MCGSCGKKGISRLRASFRALSISVWGIMPIAVVWQLAGNTILLSVTFVLVAGAQPLSGISIAYCLACFSRDLTVRSQNLTISTSLENILWPGMAVK
jgi:hypothetical protein